MFSVGIGASLLVSEECLASCIHAEIKPESE